ncbi:MAG: EVE domain-containing protein [Thermoprotei archaeon]|nr:MAG: EVE domain-containing protein [Thermoprotei archaeon]RLF03250.1 MAG: EVE domain-containing protein [Thermoprotei archaeon]HDN17723.1 EVE domain-containing protein [Candidatus Bathyarchaeota archaeon]
MPKYWICVTSEENWEVIKARGVWGVSERGKHYIMSVKPGDLLIFYVIPKRIGRIFKAVSEPYVNQEQIFIPVKSRNEIFEYRVKVEPLLLPDKPIDFVPLVEKLSFIKNKKRWSAPLRRAMLRISEEDYKVIEEEVRRHLK